MNNMVIILIAVILVSGITVIIKRIKQDKARLEFLINGTQFEANIVGVAPVPVTTATDCPGRIKIKISYVHPFSQKEITENRFLDRRDYKDDRLINVMTPDRDAEGYSILTPPVPAEAYLHNCEIMVIQKTKTKLSV